MADQSVRELLESWQAECEPPPGVSPEDFSEQRREVESLIGGLSEQPDPINLNIAFQYDPQRDKNCS